MVPDMYVMTQDNEILFTRFIHKISIEGRKDDPEDCCLVAWTTDGNYRVIWKCPNRDMAIKNLDLIHISLAKEGYMHIPSAIEALERLESQRGATPGHARVPNYLNLPSVPVSAREAWKKMYEEKQPAQLPKEFDVGDLPLPLKASDFDFPFNKEKK